MLADEVSQDPLAIGFVGLPFVNRTRALSIVGSCGIATAPTSFSIKTEVYPLGRRLFLYTIGRPAQPIARELLEFSLSDAAQSTVQEAGVVGQRIETSNIADQQTWVARTG